MTPWAGIAAALLLLLLSAAPALAATPIAGRYVTEDGSGVIGSVVAGRRSAAGWCAS